MKDDETLLRSSPALPLAVLRRIDEICALFEVVWRTGGTASLEAFLEMAPEQIRRPLFGELLRADLDFRDKSGEAVGVAAFHRRFPQYAPIIDLVFEERQKVSNRPHLEPTGPHLGAEDPVAPPGKSWPGCDAQVASIKGYEILRELGRGGMGVVYLARHLDLHRLVALKVILAGGFATAEQHRRFRSEALAVARLKHPNVVQLYATGTHDGRPYLALEYVEGRNLAERLADRPQSPRSAAALLEKVARAVHVAHQKGIVHRDLKPANILLEEADSTSLPLERCTPKVSDFGLAKHVGDEVQTAVKSRGNVVMGSPNYMAPEQARAQEVGPTTDVYSLGVILYEMLTGRPPFVGTTALDTLDQVCKQEPVPPRQLQVKCPRDLETICLTCLAKDPRQRYQSALDLANDCAAFLANRPLKARPVGPLGKLQRWAQRNPVVAGLLAVVFLLMTTGTTVSSYFAVRAHYWATAAESRAADVRQQRDRAEQLAAAETQARTRAEWLAYANQVCLAQREIERKMVPKAAMILDMCRPEFRHWEHAYLKGLNQDRSPVLDAHRSAVSAVAFHSSGRFASAALNEPIKFWDVQTTRTVLSCTGHNGAVLALAFSPSGTRLAATSNDGAVTCWDVADGRLVGAFKTNAAPIHHAAFSPDGTRVVVASATNLTVWDPSGGQQLYSLGVGGQDVVRMAFSSDSKHLAIASVTGGVVLWDLHNARMSSLGKSDGIVSDLAFSGDGARLAVAAGKQVVLWDLASNERLFACGEHAAGVHCLTFSPDNKRLFTGSSDRTVKVWEASHGQCLLTLEGHASGVTAIGISRDGKHLASTDSSGAVHLWHAAE